MRRPVLSVIAILACWGASALAAPSASAVDVYSFANGCYALRDMTSNRFVVREGSHYTATATTIGAATPFRMQATALGRYLLYGPDGADARHGPVEQGRGHHHAWAARRLGTARRCRKAAARQRVHRQGSSASAAPRRLTQVAAGPARWRFMPTTGCSRFPEVQVNVTGQPLRGSSPTARVRGFLDDHIHLGAFEFLGGRFHCGRPWSPYGVTVALKDCPDHFPNGAGAVAENFLSTGSPNGTHSSGGLAELRRLAARRVADS